MTWSTKKIGLDELGFAKYSNPADGFHDLNEFIRMRAEKGDTLESLMYRYAPPTDNSTEAYINFLAQKLSVNRADSLSSICKK